MKLIRSSSIIFAIISISSPSSWICAEPVDEAASAPLVTVSEKMLTPFLATLAGEYGDASDSRKREIEYSAYIANRTYWIHTHKFSDERSLPVENALGLLNIELEGSKPFRDLFLNWKEHYQGTDEFPDGLGYFTKLKNGRRPRFDVLTEEDWKSLHRDLYAFVEDTVRVLKARLDSWEDKKDQQNKAEMATPRKPSD